MNKELRRLRVFIGPREISNVCALLAMGMREKGITVTAVADDIRPYNDNMEYDNVFQLPQKSKFARIRALAWFFVQNCFRHDAFVFLFGVSLLPYNLDLPILRLLGKRTLMWFLGSEIRHYESVQAAAERMGIDYIVCGTKEGPQALERKLKLVRKVERYVDYVICGPSNAQLLSKHYLGEKLSNRVYLPLDVSNIEYRNAANDPPLVVHAPSNRELKGTSYVLAAVEQLRKEGHEFRFRLLTNVSNAVVRKTLAGADIAVDQLFAAGPGMLALEAMAAGCAVLGGNIPEFSGYPQALPIIHTDPGNIYQNLKMLLENPELRRELGKKGRKYVEKYHDHRKVAGQVLQLLSGNTDDLICYTPPKG